MPVRILLTVLVMTLAAAGLARAQSTPAAGDKKVAAAAPDLRSVLNDLHVLSGDFWIYNDFAAAVAEARRTSRPIFVTFRCVPCKACSGFDAEVAKGSEGLRRLAL